jgi:hypothetical protein
MQSRTTRQFRRLFSRLPFAVQQDARRAFSLFRSNPAHPGLQFKKLEGEDNIYSVRIGLDYRALAVMKKDRIVWYWIGNHTEYDRLVLIPGLSAGGNCRRQIGLFARISAGSRLVGQLNKVASVQIALRLPEPDVAKARELATRKGIGYQTLLKMLVHEGLRREARRA